MNKNGGESPPHKRKEKEKCVTIFSPRPSATGQKAFPLPEDPETAALAFLQKLTALGYAEFALDEGELDTQHHYEASPVNIKK